MKKAILFAMCALMGFGFSGVALSQGMVPPVSDTNNSSVVSTPEMAAKAEKTAFKWYNKLAQAQKVSKETGLPIIILFTGTKWCEPCQRLEKTVLKKSAFKQGMKGIAIGVKLDFPNQGAFKNSPETQKYRPFGTPCMIIVDADGNKLGMAASRRGKTPEEFIKEFKRFNPHPYAKESN